MNDELPRWIARANATRPISDYNDLMSVVAHHFRTFSTAEMFLGPYNARQRNSKFYTPPTKEDLKANIKQGGMNDISFAALLNNIIKFCEQTKGTRALPSPHPSTVHSIQLPQPAFELKYNNNACELLIPKADPIFISGVRNIDKVRFVILRPRLSKLGTPSASQWEVLLFNQNHGYIVNWVDSSINPRWAGVYN